MTIESHEFGDRKPTLPRWLVVSIVLASILAMAVGEMADALFSG